MTDSRSGASCGRGRGAEGQRGGEERRVGCGHRGTTYSVVG